jgi:molybdopterin-guanine dinucleotide biosynthesis protein A
MSSKLTIVIQAGGESKRMGQDKGLMPFLGRPLIQRVIERVRPLADEILVTTNHPESYAFLNLPMFKDVVPGRGALGGLYTALKVAAHPLVGVVACDMPFVSPELLSAERDLLIQSGADAVVPRNPGGLEPFHSIYRRETCLPAIEAALEAGKWRVDAWFSKVHLRLLKPEEALAYDPRGMAFHNLNTPEELRQAEILAAEGRKSFHPDD